MTQLEHLSEREQAALKAVKRLGSSDIIPGEMDRGRGTSEQQAKKVKAAWKLWAPVIELYNRYLRHIPADKK